MAKKTYQEVSALSKPKLPVKNSAYDNVADETLMKIIALQNELDDEQLTEWREKRTEINLKDRTPAS